MADTPELPAFPASRLRPLEAFEGAEPDLSDYADVESIAERAGTDGIVDVPAESAEAAWAGESNHLRDPVICERLWLLGYLPAGEFRTTSDHAGERDAALDAIGAFQADAGLVQDRWAGKRTWDALQELVTFEAPTSISTWWGQEGPMPALVRAVRLRLWALGFLDEQPDGTPASERMPDFALHRFTLMLKRFELLPFVAASPPLRRQVELLFDQDAILSAIAGAARRERVGGGPEKRVFRYLKERQERRAELDGVVARFLGCVATVELWLLGFDVDIRPEAVERDRPVYPVYRFQTERRPHDSPEIRRALESLWTLLGRRERHLRDAITPDLFQALADPASAAAIEEAEPWDEPDYSRQVTRELDDTEKVAGAWGVARTIGMKLWDGLKRLWRWIVGGVRKIVEVGANLARGFMRFAAKAYEIVKVAIRAVADGASRYARGELDSHTAIRVLLARDGDVRMSLPDEVDDDDVERTSYALRYFGGAFRLGCAILAALLRAVRHAVANAGIAVVGWARFLWVIVESYRDIRPLYLELKGLAASRP